MEDSKNKESIKFILVVLLAAICASWAAYRIHILAIEEFALPILEAVINFDGRAPDQYRLLPYALLRAVSELTSLFPFDDYNLRISILVFDTSFLALAALALRRNFPAIVTPKFLWLLFLIYPYLMFDGYRPISAFILFVCVIAVQALPRAQDGNAMTLSIALTSILVLSFSRADVALLYAFIFATTLHISLPSKAVLIGLPVATQALLSFVLFPNAEYFSAVLMLSRNLSGTLLLASPLSYFVLALALYYWRDILTFSKILLKDDKWFFFAIIGYAALLLLIAMPNEYRLFLPILPLILWKLELINSTS